MSQSTIIRKLFNVTFRVAFWMIVVFASTALSTAPVHAGLISFSEPSPVDRSVDSLDAIWIPTNLLLEWDSVESNGWGDVASSAPVPRLSSVPTTPSEPMPFESLLLGVEVPSSPGGSGTGARSSSSGGGTSLAAGAILSGILELSPPTLVALLQARNDQDIPSAPPFELLRPPKGLTDLS